MIKIYEVSDTCVRRESGIYLSPADKYREKSLQLIFPFPVAEHIICYELSKDIIVMTDENVEIVQKIDAITCQILQENKLHSPIGGFHPLNIIDSFVKDVINCEFLIGFKVTRATSFSIKFSSTVEIFYTVKDNNFVWFFEHDELKILPLFALNLNRVQCIFGSSDNITPVYTKWGSTHIKRYYNNDVFTINLNNNKRCRIQYGIIYNI
jgi:hypothetical protein